MTDPYTAPPPVLPVPELDWLRSLVAQRNVMPVDHVATLTLSELRQIVGNLVEPVDFADSKATRSIVPDADDMAQIATAFRKAMREIENDPEGMKLRNLREAITARAQFLATRRGFTVAMIAKSLDAETAPPPLQPAKPAT